MSGSSICIWESCESCSASAGPYFATSYSLLLSLRTGVLRMMSDSGTYTLGLLGLGTTHTCTHKQGT